MVLPTPTQAYLFNGDATDELANTNGTIDGCTLTSGNIAWAYDFDGTNDKIDLGTSLVGDADFSMAFTFKADSVNSNYYLVGRNASFFFGPWSGGTNEMAFRIYDGSTWHVVTASFSDTTSWHTAVITWDKSAGDMHMYIDNVDNSNLSGATSMAGTGNTLQLGAYNPPSDGRWFDGKIGFCAIWEGTVLSSSEVSEWHNSGTPKIYTATNGWIDDSSLEYGSLGYWKLESSALTDQVAGFDMTESGTPTYVTGKINNGIELDGTSDAASVTTDLFEFPDNTESFSLSVWINSDTATTSFDGILSTEKISTGQGWRIYRDNGSSSAKFRYRTSGAVTDVTIGTISANTWHHLCVVKDGASITTYFDGSLANTGTGVAGTMDAAGVLAIGPYRADDLANNLFDGTIDEAFITRTALTSTQVSDLYNSGLGFQYPFLANLPTPTAAYNFNGDATDEVGSNDGTISGATLTSGKVAWGYDFDGTNDNIVFSTFGTGVKTISFIANLNANISDYFLAQNSRMEVYVNSASKITVAVNTGQAMVTTPTLSTGVDYHIVVVIDGTSSAVYINGVAVALDSNTITDSSAGNASNDVYFGSYFNGSINTDGILSNLYVFNSALSSAQVSDLYNTGTPKIYTASNGWIDNTNLEYGILGYWKLENTSITDDVAGNNGVSNSGTSATGKIGNGINFNGSQSFQIPAIVTNNLNSGTVVLWSKFANETTDYNLFAKSSASFRAQYSGSNDDIYFQVNGEGTLYSNENFDWTQWHHLGFSWDGTNKYIHIDGVQSASGATTNNSPTSGNLFVGTNSVNTSERMNGDVDEIAIYARPLTSTQFSELYNAGSPGSAQQYPFAAGTPADFGILKRWNGTGWVVVPKSARKVWDGAAFTAKVWKVYDAGEWKEVGE